MHAAERKFGVLVMVEARRFPFLWRMAGLALCAMAPFVNVLQAVAGNACRLQPVIALFEMAKLTIDFLVRTDQGKVRLVMVEWLGFLPPILAVASTAVLAQPPLMGLNPLVAGDALTRRIAKFHFGFVAIRACNASVPPFQTKIGKIVIENIAVQLHDVRAPPDMVRMAMFAMGFCNIAAATVKACTGCNIGSDILVAGDAQACLIGLFERRMAALTLLFEIGMAFDERSGHDQSFKD